MNPIELYHHVAQLLKDAPDYGMNWEHSPAQQAWQARAMAALNANGVESTIDLATFRAAVSSSSTGFGPESAQRMRQCLHNLLAQCELKLPAEQRGAFISVGADYSAFASVTAILGDAQGDVLIVDPYLSAEGTVRFINSVADGVSIRLLRDESQPRYSDGLKEMARTWNNQYPARPMEIRSAPARSLHDRAILIDRTTAFAVSQSLKDLAARSPALVERVATERASEKIEAYEAIWGNSSPLT